MFSPALDTCQKLVVANKSAAGIGQVSFSGIAPAYPSAYGYHNSRDAHLAGRTEQGRGDYSVQLPSDLSGNTGQYFCGLDLSGSTPTISKRLRAACDAKDPRVRPLREWFGSLDGKVVTGNTHNAHTIDGWRLTTADNSHLWHVHLSLFRCCAADLNVGRALADVILGKTFTQPVKSTRKEEIMIVRQTNKGAHWSTDGVTRRWVENPQHLAALQAALKAAGLHYDVIVVNDVDAFGPVTGKNPGNV